MALIGTVVSAFISLGKSLRNRDKKVAQDARDRGASTSLRSSDLNLRKEINYTKGIELNTERSAISEGNLRAKPVNPVTSDFAAVDYSTNSGIAYAPKKENTMQPEKNKNNNTFQIIIPIAIIGGLVFLIKKMR